MGPCDNPRLRCVRAHTHTHTHTQIASLSFLGERQRLQGVTCTKLSSFLNDNVYKQLEWEKKTEGARGLVKERRMESRERKMESGKERVGIV